MYWRRASSGVPSHDAAKQDGDQSTPRRLSHGWKSPSGCRNIRLDTPFSDAASVDSVTFGRVVHQQMDMVVPAVKFHQPGFEFLAHIREDGLHRLKALLAEYNAPISGHEDQMHMQREYAVPPVTQAGVCLSWRTLHFPCKWF
jgi:hypothetical protein